MDGAEPALRLRLSEGRAWATVAHSLSREGFLLWDEDSERKLYYVQYLDPTKKRNWLVRLFTFEPASEAKTTDYRLSDLLSHMSGTPESQALFGDIPGVTTGEPLEKGLGYLVVLKREQGDIIARVRDHRGDRLDLETNKRMLAVIRRNLI